MRKQMKKTIAVLLSVLMCTGVLTSLPATAFAAETNSAVGATSGITGDCTWTLDDDGTLTISGNGKMGDYDYHPSAPWRYLSIQNVIIENGVTSIGNKTFDGCTKLASVTIPNSVTNIGDYAFFDCTGLTSVNIPDSVTSIGDGAFYSCTGLTSVTIPDSVTSIGNSAFEYCTRLASITIGNGETSIGYDAFRYTTWYDNQQDGLIYVGKVAYKYKGLCPAKVEIKAGTLVITGYAFSGCSGLKSVNIPDSVTSIGDGAFYSCTGLTSVTIPDSVTSIGSSVFSHCTGLANVTIPGSVTSISSYAFFDCSGLTSVTIPDSVTSIGTNVFTGCTGLTSVIIPDSVTSIGSNAFEYCTGLTSVTIPNSVTSIGNQMFDGCTKLTSVTIPDSVKSIGTCVFTGCTGLTSITIPDSVTSIGNSAFSHCSGLTSIAVDSNNKIYDSRNRCNAIINTKDNQLIVGCQNTIIPDSVTSIGEDAFYGCTGLTSVTIPDSVTIISGGAFFGCKGLSEITIPNSVMSIGNSTFNGCTGLTNVTIPDSVNSIGYWAFKGCTGLTSVTIPDSVTSIGDWAFGYYEDNDELKKIASFTVYGMKGSEAETYANENGFKFVEMSESIEKTDEDTGVSVTLTEDLTLKVDDAIEGDSIKNMVLVAGESVVRAFDITLLKDGAEAQPDTNVTVKIPCDKENAKVYRVEADNTLTDMKAVYQDGYLVFTTDHFSVYVVTEPKTVLIGDVNDDGKVNGADAGLLNRYTSGWEGYAEKIKNMDAADINRDGKVNGADSGLLNRYTSGWDTVKKYFTAA